MSPLRGAYAVYGISVGIIMLDCRFPRPIGDIGNARTFPFPVQYEILMDVPPADLLTTQTPAAVQVLVNAAKKLERHGVSGILTSCGLLIRYQQLLSRAVGIPVATSSLVMLPVIGTMLAPNRAIGIIASKASDISQEALVQAGWHAPDRVVVAGLDGSRLFHSAILDPRPPYELNPEGIYEEVLTVCRHMMADRPDVGALVLECTNLGPYSARLRADLQVPVFDVIHLAHLLHAAI
jgi:hypothetical protein